MASIHSLKTLILDLPPSCIEFWPLDPRYAVIGTYNLEKTESEGQGAEREAETEAEAEEGEPSQIKKSQSRNGSLILIQVDGDNM